jgi:hypothetical protein
MLTRRLAGSAALLTGATVVALSIVACGPTASSSGAPGSISTSATPTTAASAAPTSSSGAPSGPTHYSPPNGASLPVGTVPVGGAGNGTLVPLPPYTPVPSSQISVVGMPAQQPSGVQTAEGGRVLIFHEEQAGCQQVTAQLAGQGASQVVVDVTVASPTTAGRMCPMIVRVVPVTVALSAPLGNRTIVFQQTLKH